MICSKCGNKITDDSAYCPVCGHKLGCESQVQEKDTETVDPENQRVTPMPVIPPEMPSYTPSGGLPPVTPKGKGVSRALVAVLIVVALVAATAAALWIFGSHEKADDTAATHEMTYIEAVRS